MLFITDSLNSYSLVGFKHRHYDKHCKRCLHVMFNVRNFICTLALAYCAIRKSFCLYYHKIELI